MPTAESSEQLTEGSRWETPSGALGPPRAAAENVRYLEHFRHPEDPARSSGDGQMPKLTPQAARDRIPPSPGPTGRVLRLHGTPRLRCFRRCSSAGGRLVLLHNMPFRGVIRKPHDHLLCPVEAKHVLSAEVHNRYRQHWGF